MKVIMFLVSLSLSTAVMANGARGKYLENKEPQFESDPQEQQEKGPKGRPAVEASKKGKLDISEEEQKRKRKGM